MDIIREKYYFLNKLYYNSEIKNDFYLRRKYIKDIDKLKLEINKIQELHEEKVKKIEEMNKMNRKCLEDINNLKNELNRINNLRSYQFINKIKSNRALLKIYNLFIKKLIQIIIKK